MQSGAGEIEGERRALSLTRRLVLSVALVLGLGATAVALAALAYGRRAAQEAYDRLLVGAANQIAGAVSVIGDSPAPADGMSRRSTICTSMAGTSMKRGTR